MKYTVMTIVLVIAGTLVLAQSELAARRERQHSLVLQQHALKVRRELAGLGVEELIRRSHNCEDLKASAEPPNYDAIYCAEVARAIDAIPLRLAPVRPSPRVPLPSSRAARTSARVARAVLSEVAG
jgi:hypothetical protein